MNTHPAPQLTRLVDQIAHIIVGKRSQIEDSVACLLAAGHLLIEDVPGVGKTTLAHTLAVIGVVVGELVGGDIGLGFLLIFFEGQGNTAAVFVVIAALTAVGIVAYYAVVLIERKVLHYLPSAQRRVS